MATTVARLEAILSANTAQYDRAMMKSDTTMRKVSKTAGLVGAAILGGVAFGLEKSVKAALRAQTSQVRLEQAFKRSGLSAALYAKQVAAAESAGRKLGFTDEEIKTSLGSLIVATHSYAKAQQTMSTAQDIARFKSVSLVDATKMLTMAMTGSQRAAKQLGITVQPLTTNFDALSKGASNAEKAHAKFLDKLATGNAVVDAVNEKLHGQAQAYADTAAGGMAQFRAQLDHLEVSLGTAVLPALVSVTEQLSTMLGFLNKHTTATKIAVGAAIALGAALVSLSIAEKAYRVATILATAAQWALNVAMDANPIGAIIAALVILTATLIVVQKRYDGVTKAVQFLTRNWYLMLVPLGLAPAAIGFVIKKLLDIGAPTAVVRALGVAFERVLAGVRWLISAIQSLISWLGKIRVPHISLPHIPGSGIFKAAGGGVKSGQAYIVGEKGPEMFVPGTRGSIVPNNRLSAAPSGGTVVIPVSIGGERIATVVFDMLRRKAQVFENRNARPAW